MRYIEFDEIDVTLKQLMELDELTRSKNEKLKNAAMSILMGFDELRKAIREENKGVKNDNA